MPKYNYPSSRVNKKRTALPYEIYSMKKRNKFDWKSVLEVSIFISIMVMAVAVIYFDNFILPTMGI